MIIGGSSGLRTRIALPRPAPPTVSIAREVVTVNSSMLARVPGPADRDAIDTTISAYGTGTTELTALTIGIVACPPQVIMLKFGAPMWKPRLTGGHTKGPMAAGVRSTAWMPASWYRAALARWAEVLVASNTRSGSSDCASSQSTPSGEASSPSERARARPSEAGDRPIM